MAIQMRTGSSSDLNSYKSKMLTGEIAVLTDGDNAGRTFVGIPGGNCVELARVSDITESAIKAAASGIQTKISELDTKVNDSSTGLSTKVANLLTSVKAINNKIPSSDVMINNSTIKPTNIEMSGTNCNVSLNTTKTVSLASKESILSDGTTTSEMDITVPTTTYTASSNIKSAGYSTKLPNFYINNVNPLLWKPIFSDKPCGNPANTQNPGYSYNLTDLYTKFAWNELQIIVESRISTMDVGSRNVCTLHLIRAMIEYELGRSNFTSSSTLSYKFGAQRDDTSTDTIWAGFRINSTSNTKGQMWITWVYDNGTLTSNTTSAAGAARWFMYYR